MRKAAKMGNRLTLAVPWSKMGLFESEVVSGRICKQPRQPDYEQRVASAGR